MPPLAMTAIPDALLRAVHASDQEMYPVALPYARLRAWVDACPGLSICFQHSDTPSKDSAAAGVIIVLPLRRAHWEDLLVGRLKEPDIDPAVVFPRDGGGVEGGEVEEVGLHVYHIERFGTELGSSVGVGGEPRRFSEFAIDEITRRAQARPGWKVVGMSALTATDSGRRTFERLGLTPTGYRELFVAAASNGGIHEHGESRQTDVICLYPGDGDDPGKAAGGRAIISFSEMTVRYSVLPSLARS